MTSLKFLSIICRDDIYQIVFYLLSEGNDNILTLLGTCGTICRTFPRVLVPGKAFSKWGVVKSEKLRIFLHMSKTQALTLNTAKIFRLKPCHTGLDCMHLPVSMI